MDNGCAILPARILFVLPMEGISIIFILVLVALCAAAIAVFNRLIRARNACDNARGGVDANLMKRHDLIPNLIRLVKAYAEHEQETLRVVTRARADAIASLGTQVSPASEAQLSQALKLLEVRIEAYPELKASEHFDRLSRTLTEIEEQISASRRALNAHVMVNNNLVQQFPSHLIARAAGFRPRDYFSAQGIGRLTPESNGTTGRD